MKSFVCQSPSSKFSTHRHCALGVIAILATGCTPATDVTATAPGFSPAFAKPAGMIAGITQLPGLGGSSEAYAVNDLGQVFGYSVDGVTRLSHTVRWQKEGSVWTITRIGAGFTQGLAATETGTVAGTKGDSAAVWIPGEPVAAFGRGEARGVNASNVVVGYQWSVLPTRPAAWVREGGVWSMKILPPIAGETATSNCLTSANAINEAGIIVGVAYDTDCTKQTAVLWMPKANPADGWEAAVPLAGADAMAKSIAYGIVGNIVVGEAWPCPVLDGCARRPYKWSITGEVGGSGPLGTIDGRSNGVNSAGVSGGSYIDRKMRPVVWAAGGASFQTLAEFKGWYAHWVWDVNNRPLAGGSHLAVGGALDGRGGRYAIVWSIP